MQNYLDLLKKVLEEGEETLDRTGVGTKRIFAPQLRFKFEGNKIPIITTKKVFMKGVIVELLWFLQGSTNIKYLLENNVHIWDEWADDMGELGPVYGKQWRAWETKEGNKIDQISNIINSLRNNPTSRRIILNAWNVGEIDKMHLPPCHMMCQFSVNSKGGIITHLYQRSADLFLGVPFNISSYAILTRLLAMHSGLYPSELIMTFGDAHIYNNHIEQVKTQLTREPYPQEAELFINEAPNIFSHVYEDFKIENYKFHPAIKGEVAV